MAETDKPQLQSTVAGEIELKTQVAQPKAPVVQITVERENDDENSVVSREESLTQSKSEDNEKKYEMKYVIQASLNNDSNVNRLQIPDIHAKSQKQETNKTMNDSNSAMKPSRDQDFRISGSFWDANVYVRIFLIFMGYFMSIVSLTYGIGQITRLKVPSLFCNVLDIKEIREKYPKWEQCMKKEKYTCTHTY